MSNNGENFHPQLRMVHGVILHCPKCRKHYTSDGVWTREPIGKEREVICETCRAQLPHTEVTITRWPEDKHTRIFCTCTVCMSTPCEHCPPDVVLASATTLRAIKAKVRFLLEPHLRSQIDHLLEGLLAGNPQPEDVKLKMRGAK